MEKELVGTCALCGVPIHCHNGFLEGIVEEKHTLVCFSCYEDNEADPS